MILGLARQSVIIKCRVSGAELLGNYEFYYAAGLLTNLTGKALSGESRPQELFDAIREQLQGISLEGKNEEQLIRMLHGYRVSAEYDDQMREMFEMGRQEKFLWQVNLPA